MEHSAFSPKFPIRKRVTVIQKNSLFCLSPPTRRDYQLDNETRLYLTPWPVQSIVYPPRCCAFCAEVARACGDKRWAVNLVIGRDSIFAPRARWRSGLPWRTFHPRLLRRAPRSMLLPLKPHIKTRQLRRIAIWQTTRSLVMATTYHG